MAESGLFDLQALGRLVDQHANGNFDNTQVLWNSRWLKVFSRLRQGCRTWVRRRGVASHECGSNERPCEYSLRVDRAGVRDAGAVTVSVVIPAYNAAATIAAAIESVLAQTRLPEEIIVVDDGSNDETSAVVERFGPIVRLLRQANAGCGQARNSGAREARGTWLAFLDADDLWLPTKLERQLPETGRPSDRGSRLPQVQRGATTSWLPPRVR